jgi:hypothetical protein
MEPTTHTTASSISSQVASSAPPDSPTELSDAELLTATRRLVGRSNLVLASLLAHLGEVEARGIHRLRACASLYAYCIYELRFSEDEAFRRVSAARLVRRFPVLLEAVAAGELHLTGLLMLGPLLTPDNLGEVLARAKHRTKKELARLVRSLDPLPTVPPRIEPLGPASLQLAPGAPSWSRWMSAMNPVRELDPGARPRDWMDGAFSANDASEHFNDGPAPAEHAPARAEGVRTSAKPAPARVNTVTASAKPAPATPTRGEPQRYNVQFEASEEYVELVERAKALLSHTTPRADLSELHLRAMRVLAAALERQKYAVLHVCERLRGALPGDGAARATSLARVRAGGEHRLENVTLRCRAHNTLAAEQDFGRDFVGRARDSTQHEPWSVHDAGSGAATRKGFR